MIKKEMFSFIFSLHSIILLPLSLLVFFVLQIKLHECKCIMA